MSFDWDEGCQTKEERGENRQIAQAVSQGKADFINGNVHVCVNTQREKCFTLVRLISSRLCLCLMDYIWSCN